MTNHIKNIWHTSIPEIWVGILTIITFIVCVWYLFWGAGLADIYPSIHVTFIESISRLPAPKTHNLMRGILEEQGYISILQLQEIVELANAEVNELPL